MRAVTMILEGKVVRAGNASGEALVTEEPISFLGGVDPETGEVVESGHQLEGECVKDRVLVFPNGKGSTVGSYVIYQLASNGLAPAAMINRKTETIVAAGAILADIPLVHELDEDPVGTIDTGDQVSVRNGKVRVEKR